MPRAFRDVSRRVTSKAPNLAQVELKRNNSKVPAVCPALPRSDLVLLCPALSRSVCAVPLCPVGRTIRAPTHVFPRAL